MIDSQTLPAIALLAVLAETFYYSLAAWSLYFMKKMFSGFFAHVL